MAFRPAMVIVATALLASCGPGKFYPVASDVALEELARSSLPRLVLGNDGNEQIVRKQVNGVIWSIADENGQEYIRLSAKVLPARNGSRIVTDVMPPDGPKRDLAAKALTTNRAFADLYRGIAREQVASVMEHRDFNERNLTIELTAMAFSLAPQLERNAAAYEKKKQENISNAYAHDASAKRLTE